MGRCNCRSAMRNVLGYTQAKRASSNTARAGLLGLLFGLAACSSGGRTGPDLSPQRVPPSCTEYTARLERCFPERAQVHGVLGARARSTESGLVVGITDEASFEVAENRCRRASDQLAAS